MRDDNGEVAVDDVFIDLTFGGVLARAIVAMRPAVPGHAKRIGRLIAAMSPIKRITLVDSAVDIRDSLHIEWAMNARFNPVRDTVIIDEVFFPLHMDPSIRPAGGVAPQGSKIIIDATQKNRPRHVLAAAARDPDESPRLVESVGVTGVRDSEAREAPNR